jgi:hypothetical protein
MSIRISNLAQGLLVAGHRAEEITWTAISVGLAALSAVLLWLFIRRPGSQES